MAANEGSGGGGVLLLFRVLHELADLLDVLENQLRLVKAELEREAIIRVEDDHRVALVLARLRAAGRGAAVGVVAHGEFGFGFMDQRCAGLPLGLVTVPPCVAPFVSPFERSRFET